MMRNHMYTLQWNTKLPWMYCQRKFYKKEPSIDSCCPLLDHNNGSEEDCPPANSELGSCRIRADESRHEDTSKVASMEALSVGVDELGITEIVCYGLGHVSSCPIARLQLCLLSIMRELLQVKCIAFDPIFTASEKAYLTQQGISLIEKNEEGRRRACNGGTLFFMPHCDKPLYSNLLCANWEPEHLSRVILVGNSFRNMAENLPCRKLQELAPFVLKVLPHVVEIPVKNNHRFNDVFNDLSIHIFPGERLKRLPCVFWDSVPDNGSFGKVNG
ncbi:PREDICTED: SRR1-like protein isoform X2 [Priapulus caudatus]|uniref:SRR1-like protein isoform X2 n=1 Tax=Priapulus caudatus TaxID=37621 RepID=A0ABM1E391_PRICU|nr:PREDICTED: SRR1-like protein isoform X2 [Priapulus caudatus]